MGNYVDCDKDSSVLREYFLADRRSRERFADAHAFDAFFRDVEKMLSLRVRAEDIFSKNRHLAKHSRGPLPLTAAQIRETLGNADGAPVRIIVRAARACEIPLTEIRKNFRRILARERCRIPIAKVTELDSACMIWQSRQPGNTLGEKAGSRQRILSVVKVENFNTLENRVLKDFLIRAERLCDDYLAEFGDEKTAHDVNVERVRGFQRRCKSVLQENALAGIPENRGGLPTPNYVLQQNPHYSQIWKFYKEFISLTQLLETLWESRAELQETLKKLAEYSAPVPAKSGDVLWFRKIDDWRRNSAGNASERFLENPFWENKFPAAHGKALPAGTPSETAKARIVDLATGTVCLPTADARRIQRNLLVYPLSRHGNAKPYLQDFEYPRNEDFSLGGKLVDVNEIFSAPDNFSFDRRFPEPNAERIGEYFEQLDGICAEIDGNARKNAEWIILVPDEWSQFMQEALIQKVPAPRENVRLLWRSVAAALGDPEKMRRNGAREGTQFFVAETGADGFSRETRLFRKKNQHGNIVPKRRAFATHHSSDKRRTASNDFWVNAAEICNGYPCRMRFYYGKRTTYRGNDGDFTTEQLLAGARRFEEMRSRGEIPYYDELDTLSLVVQTPDEKLIWQTLVEGKEDWPGGKPYEPEPKTDVARLQKNSSSISFYLCVGPQSSDVPLKEKTEEIDERLTRTTAVPVDMSVRCLPGQGFAQLTFYSRNPEFSATLDLQGMKDSTHTLFELEQNLPRSFPPDLPHVECDTNWWRDTKTQRILNRYIDGNGTLPGDFFAHSAWLFPSGKPLPAGSLPTDRFRRKNCFGHCDLSEIPFAQTEKLLEKLVRDFGWATNDDYRDDILRLIAWTYQADFEPFRKVKDAVKKKMREFHQNWNFPGPNRQCYTVCANLFSSEDDLKFFYEGVISKLTEDTPGKRYAPGTYLPYLGGGAFRALANLLQFNERFVKDSGCAMRELEITRFTRGLVKWLRYIIYKKRDERTERDIVKSLMFLLRARKEPNCENYMRIGTALHNEIMPVLEERRKSLSKDPARQADAELYRNTMAYIDGNGTLDGIPMDAVKSYCRKFRK